MNNLKLFSRFNSFFNIFKYITMEISLHSSCSEFSSTGKYMTLFSNSPHTLCTNSLPFALTCTYNSSTSYVLLHTLSVHHLIGALRQRAFLPTTSHILDMDQRDWMSRFKVMSSGEVLHWNMHKKMVAYQVLLVNQTHIPNSPKNYSTTISIL